ncbi:MAG: PilN domain-containing protein [Xanthobacteraceae bacterium]
MEDLVSSGLTSWIPSFDAPLSDLAGRLGAWWLGEWLALLPDRATEWLRGGSRKLLVIGLDGTYTEVALLSDARQILATAHVEAGAFSAETIAAFLKQRGLDRAGVEFGLRLPAEKIFHRTLRLPREAAPQIDAVLARDLAAKTPFRAQDIHVGWVRCGAGDARTILVSQWIVRRQIVLDAAATLKLAAADLAFVEGEGVSADGVVPSIPLRENSDGGRSWFSKAASGLAITAVLLALLAAGADYYRQQSMLDALDAKIATARVKAQQVRAAIDGIEQSHAVLVKLRARKADAPGLLDIWEEATQILPAHSWLTELRISQAPGEESLVSMVGFSSAAASLVGLVDHSALFSDASLTAPITLDPIESRERFSLQAKLNLRDQVSRAKP